MPVDEFVSKLLKQYADQYNVEISDIKITAVTRDSEQKEIIYNMKSL